MSRLGGHGGDAGSWPRALLSIHRLPGDCHSDSCPYSPHFEDGSVEPPTSGATPSQAHTVGNIYQAPSEAAPPVLSSPPCLSSCVSSTSVATSSNSIWVMRKWRTAGVGYMCRPLDAVCMGSLCSSAPFCTANANLSFSDFWLVQAFY